MVAQARPPTKQRYSPIADRDLRLRKMLGRKLEQERQRSREMLLPDVCTDSFPEWLARIFFPEPSRVNYAWFAALSLATAVISSPGQMTAVK